MDINQVYRAPSIPKIGKRSVSSSVLRGATTPKLKVSTVKFGKPKITAETIQSVSSPARISQSLVETNLILVEIQKQLAIDFANRIAEEKELIKGIKKAESRRKFGAKEKFVESTKKIGSAIGGAVSKITSPVKTVFERIVDFFKTILTGIVLNAAFKWLEDPANKAKLFAVFDFIGKYWKELVITFIGVKVLGFISKLIGLGRLIGKFFGKGGPGSPGGKSGPGSPGGGCGPVHACLNKIRDPKKLDGFVRTLLKNAVFITALSKLLPSSKPSAPSAPAPAPKQGQGFFDLIGQMFREAYTFRKDPDFAFSLLIAQQFGNIGRKPGGIVPQLTLKQKLDLMRTINPASYSKFKERIKSTGMNPKDKAAMDAVRDMEAQAERDFARFLTGKDPSKMTPEEIMQIFRSQGYKSPAIPKKSRARGGTIKASMGMTVPGRGSGNVDSVNAMLAPGEEVIRTASAMMFRPLLKDINDNAGRLWNTFSQAVTTLISVSAKQKEVSENFDSVTTEFSRYLQDETRKQKFGTGGGTKVSSSPKKPNISSTPKVINLINQGVPVGKGGVNVFSLPPTKSKPPEIPQIQTSETKVPVISPIDFTNPWMDITPELYGIQLYG